MHSTGHVTTDRAERYGKQLVAHLGRRHGGNWSEEGHGTITLRDGHAELRATADEMITTVVGPDVDQLEDVVERHLVRFGERDELRVAWSRSPA